MRMMKKILPHNVRNINMVVGDVCALDRLVDESHLEEENFELIPE